MKTDAEVLEHFQSLHHKISIIRRGLDIEKLKLRFQELKLKIQDNNLWQDHNTADRLLKLHAHIKDTIDSFLKIESDYNNSISLMQVAIEEHDLEFFLEVKRELLTLEKLILRQEQDILFTQAEDKNDCFLELQSGAGGTESNDWAEILLRMYIRWAEIYHNFQVEIVDKLVGDEIGIKSATIKIMGEKAYGWSKHESGIHRLVRISPFDSNGKRHTSFVSVGVIPIIDETINILIHEKDLKIDSYRASGAGGQHVNKTDSAIRITHIPTGVIVQCQNHRSQHRNKDEAIKILKGRLYQRELTKQENSMTEQYHKKCDIGWGNQVRSYVMHPYHMVKDLRTGYEEGNLSAIFNGNIDHFIMSMLTHNMNTKS
ncbi:peptide chain release factor 2 [Wolbachia endosymbiont of Howardula sp.]|nr:peptide chain release factor 2 [Wolbachia endosymbiont of Howardula sp.]UWI83374.1 peptide chain release factor 2 [Wolbachia endosymbiont of Howardula sp.]